MDSMRYIGVVILTALILVFALQNLEAVSVDLLFWNVSASVALIALAPFLVGLVVGSAASFLRRRQARTQLPRTDARPSGEETGRNAAASGG
jgi:uncharacterized integral membrane protein